MTDLRTATQRNCGELMERCADRPPDARGGPSWVATSPSLAWGLIRRGLCAGTVRSSGRRHRTGRRGRRQRRPERSARQSARSGRHLDGLRNRYLALLLHRGSSHHAGAFIYVAALFMFVGLAHADQRHHSPLEDAGFRCGSSGGPAVSPVSSSRQRQDLSRRLYATEMLFGMVFFGLYAMWLERQRPSARCQQHA